jgi:transcriptional antiterminator RfaH
MNHWYALHAKPHKERQVFTYLKSEGFEVYLPMYPAARRSRRRALPFFSCYLFARLNGADHFSTVRWTPGLRRIVSFGGKPARVPEEVITSIKEHLDWLWDTGQAVCPFEKGDRVRVAKGALRDLDGIFEERLSSRDRAHILVDCLGRWTRCEVDMADLKGLR